MGDSQVSFKDFHSYKFTCQVVYCFAGIFNGKSWVKAMRSFRGVAAALMKRFLSDGVKTFEDIEQYLDAARLHPTGLTISFSQLFLSINLSVQRGKVT